MSNNKQYNDLIVLFLSCALREAASNATQDIPYRHKLKQQMNGFIETYNREITPQLLRAYSSGDNDTHFEAINGMLEDICRTFANVRPDNYPLVVGLLTALNEGKLFAQTEVKEEAQNDDEN